MKTRRKKSKREGGGKKSFLAKGVNWGGINAAPEGGGGIFQGERKKKDSSGRE